MYGNDETTVRDRKFQSDFSLRFQMRGWLFTLPKSDRELEVARSLDHTTRFQR